MKKQQLYVTDSNWWQRNRLSIAVAVVLLAGNVVQWQWTTLFPVKVIETPTLNSMIRSACPVSNNQPVAVIISATSPTDLRLHLDTLRHQLRKYEEYSYVAKYKPPITK